jgi:hypothetical protein
VSGKRTLATAFALCAGSIAAPLVWALNMELGQILPSVDCAGLVRSLMAASLAATAVALAAGALSWRRGNARDSAIAAHAPTLRFVGSVAALTAFVIAFALAMQSVATLVLSGCER